MIVGDFMRFIMYVPSPFGLLMVYEEDGFITSLHFPGEAKLPASESATPLLLRAKDQLSGYFAGTRFHFDLPLNPSGTSFCRDVWNTLMTVPYAATVSYGELAAMSAHPNAARAVGQAVHKNPIPILIPCHRVIRTDHSLGGFALGTAVKQQLLDFETEHGGFYVSAP